MHFGRMSTTAEQLPLTAPSAEPQRSPEDHSRARRRPHAGSDVGDAAAKAVIGNTGAGGGRCPGQPAKRALCREAALRRSRMRGKQRLGQMQNGSVSPPAARE
ncbi:hypothetical protein GN956_G3779 [Arapaima gigas]